MILQKPKSSGRDLSCSSSHGSSEALFGEGSECELPNNNTKRQMMPHQCMQACTYTYTYTYTYLRTYYIRIVYVRILYACRKRMYMGICMHACIEPSNEPSASCKLCNRVIENDSSIFRDSMNQQAVAAAEEEARSGPGEWSIDFSENVSETSSDTDTLRFRRKW
jgi:hypothetical protein